MKTAISVPDPVFEEADRLAEQLGLTRSALYAQAVAEFVERHRSDSITEKLNALYSDSSAKVGPILQQLQLSSLPREKW